MSRAARGCSAPLRKSCFAMSGVQQGKKIRSFKYITCPQFQKMPGALDILKIISEKLKKQVKVTVQAHLILGAPFVHCCRGGP